MKQLTCEMCGSTDMAKQDGFFVCQTCGMKYSAELAKFKNITAVGRLAEYRYYDIDDIVKHALEVFAKTAEL